MKPRALLAGAHFHILLHYIAAGCFSKQKRVQQPTIFADTGAG